jgi:hypothetical protein
MANDITYRTCFDLLAGYPKESGAPAVVPGRPQGTRTHSNFFRRPVLKRSRARDLQRAIAAACPRTGPTTLGHPWGASTPSAGNTVEPIRHQSLNVGSVQPPQTQGKVQSAVRLALSGRYLLQASARTGLTDCQTISNVPKELILPIITGFERW